MSDECAYIRNLYGVPAKIGMRVKVHTSLSPYYWGTGVIKSASHYIHVLIDGETHTRAFHPTYLVTYYDEQGQILKEYGDD